VTRRAAFAQFDSCFQGRSPEKAPTPVEQLTISIAAIDGRRGTLAMAWGPFRWTAPIEVR
jgi:hypothetical protein